MNFKDFICRAKFSSNIVINLQTVLSRAKAIDESAQVNYGLKNISKSFRLINQRKYDFSFLEQNQLLLNNCKLVNIIFHCPFIKNELPGTFYMPKLHQDKVDRSAFICTLTALHRKLNSPFNPLTILITTPSWYFHNLNSFQYCKGNIIPVFLNDEIEFPMYYRHCSYIAAFNKLKSLMLNNSSAILSFHDSDLLPISSWGHILEMMSQQCFDLLFTYRYSPNLLPLNGGLFFASLNSRSQQLLNYSLGLFDDLSLDPLISSIYPSSIKIWDGDQIVLNTIYQWDNENPFFQYSWVNDAKLGILPAWSSNYTIKKDFSIQLLKELANRGVTAIHLKGLAKESLNLDIFDWTN